MKQKWVSSLAFSVTILSGALNNNPALRSLVILFSHLNICSFSSVRPFCFHVLEGWFAYLSLILAFFETVD